MIWIANKGNGDLVAYEGQNGPEFDVLAYKEQLDDNGDWKQSIQEQWLDWLEGKAERP